MIGRVIRLTLRRKLGFLGLILGVLMTMGTAAEISTNQTTSLLEPGVNQTLAHLNVSSPDNTTEILDTTHNFPFPVWLVNQTRTVTQHQANNSTQYNTTMTADIVVRPPHDFEPGNRSNTYHLILPSESKQLQFDYGVREVRNWTATPTNLSQNVSVGSTGRFGAVVVKQRGNADQDITTNITGPLREFLKVERSFSVHPDTPHTVRLSHQVPADTQFGNYTGQLVLTSGTETRPVNLSAVFSDEILPTIHDVEVSAEVMATTEPTWELAADDNLAVASVIGNVSRVVTVTYNNTTRSENVSVASVAFPPENHTDRWQASFTDTADRGQYYVNLTVIDTAGNQVSTVRSFQIKRLESLQVQATNFEFESVRPDEPLTHDVFEIETETPVTVTLSSFTEFQTNDSMVPGIRKVGEASADTLTAVGDSITVSEPGTYELVVETDEKGRFKGKLNYSTVAQHIAVPSSLFRGQFIDPQCPEESRFETRNYTYDFRYSAGGCVGGRAELVISLPGEQCQGYETAEQCINVRGLDFGRIEDLESTVGWWKLVTGIAISIAFGAILLTAAVWVFERRRWPYLDFEVAKEAD